MELKSATPDLGGSPKTFASVPNPGLSVAEKPVSPSDIIVKSVDIHEKPSSFVGAAGASVKDQQIIQTSSHADLVDVVTIGVPSLTGMILPKKPFVLSMNGGHPGVMYVRYLVIFMNPCPKKEASPPIVSTSNVVTLTVEKTNDGFQTADKKKKRKGKPKSTNGA
ncbi:hypothetical protein Tco_0619489 [Tanacetum coccineum]